MFDIWNHQLTTKRVIINNHIVRNKDRKYGKNVGIGHFSLERLRYIESLGENTGGGYDGHARQV